ncbi:MAG: acetyl-CoA C-acyltransferase [Alphaproteobacteria bacterium]|nr:acetyl-CoA C-acyltransferase [Alphaproteobacteria bacterium]MCB9698478.1 acetyl-CoA C-acyltransferase [Alphaproteobacteria bacterium]
MGRAVIVGGARTPFVRAFEQFTRIDTIELGNAAVRGVLERTRLPYEEVQSVVWGGVILPPTAPNVGREIALDVGLPRSAEAMTVTRACASGLQSIALAVHAIERGECDVAIAGGSDSTSNAPLTMPQSLVHKVAPVALSRKSGASDWARVAGSLSLRRDLLPQQPKIAERTTGQVMGEAAEEMARRNEISREAQDAFAVRSHHLAAAAIRSGRFDNEVVPVQPERGEPVFADTMVRGDTSVDKLAKLRPAFAKDGTLTAGNSTALTDGAAAVLLMEESKARALGYTPLAAFRSFGWSGVDPADQLLMGPALAMPLALKRAGMELSDVDLVDLHEAFAAQVLAILKMLGSDAFAKARLGRDKAVGQIDDDKLNVHGGSVAIGHPFGATGARMALTMANELHLRGKGTALLGICAAGGLGAAAVMEAV